MSKHVLSPAERSCTGCGACSATCPHGAIHMKLSSEGFYVPEIDETACVDCGLCQKVCYRFQEIGRDTVCQEECPVVGACSGDPAVQAASTSGGVAFELSRWGLENGFHVIGVVYDAESHCARTVLVHSPSELSALTGSKYLQSATQEAFAQLLDEAKKDKEQKYICIGTPCQIYGLRKLMRVKRISNECIYVDLFCHGVPSYNVWNPYVSETEKRIGAFRQVNFRSKRNGWHQYTIEIKGQHKTYCQYAYKDRFYRYFFDNIALNASCYTCLVRKKFTAADLRLGDFLGGKYENREDGVNAVLLATEKGKELVVRLQQEGRLVVGEEMPADVCLQSQSTHDYSPALQPVREEVLRRLHAGDSVAAVQKWYFKRLPITGRLRAMLKMAATLLPLSLIIRIRRMVR